MSNTNTVAQQQNTRSLSFISNKGQTDSTIQFHVHTMAGTLLFKQDEVIFRLPHPERSLLHNKSVGDSQSQEKCQAKWLSTIRLRYDNASPDVRLQEDECLPGLVHYLLGDDARQWQTDLPTYVGITYIGLYPGIDLCYKDAKGYLKSTYLLAPYADPSHIRWLYEGVSDIRIDEETGALRLQVSAPAHETEAITIFERAPIAWQEIGSICLPVQVHYQVAADNSVSFYLEDYDPSYPLIIDPVMQFSTYLGGEGDEISTTIAVDPSGNIYVAGNTASSGFPTTAGGYQTTYQGNTDIFVTKLSNDGSTLLYSTYIGSSSGYDNANAIAVDSAGNILITGSCSSGFPTTTGAYRTSAPTTNNNAFIAKLSSSGGSLIYATYLGGSGGSEGHDIAVDAVGYAYATGIAYSTTAANVSDFPTTAGAFQTSFSPGIDPFVVKLNPAGDQLVYSTFVGAGRGLAIAVDGIGNVYITGNTSAGGLPVTPGAFQSASHTFFGTSTAFIAKLNSTGSALLYATYLGGSGGESGNDIAIDQFGNVYVTGDTLSQDFPVTPNAIQSYSLRSGTFDAFVTKLNDSGTGLIYSTYLSGSSSDVGNGIAVDALNNIYVTGNTISSDFITKDALQSSLQGRSDAFITKIDNMGNLIYSSYLGGTGIGTEAGNDIAVDAFANVYVVGITATTDFPTQKPYQSANAGGQDIFIAKIAFAPPEPVNTGCWGGDCSLGWSGENCTGNPVGLRHGEKYESIVDLSLNTPSGDLSFTRIYRQNKQSIYNFMGLGWTHIHAAFLSKTVATPNTILVQMPHGGELHLTESASGSNHYVSDPGSTAFVDWDGTQYTLTTMDKSKYVFDSTGHLQSITWSNSEVWTYTYSGGNLASVSDAYGRSLQFTYINNLGQFNHGKLWRVGDQTATGLNGGSPMGRYVEFGYITEKSNGSSVASSRSLLSTVRDVLGNTWIYIYYGQAVGETDSRQLNFLTKYLSPSVDVTGSGIPAGSIALKTLSYSYDTQLAVNGDMEINDTSWSAVSSAPPSINQQSTVQTHTGGYSRYVVANAVGQGIEGLPWNLVQGRTYTISAWVYPVSGTVQMHVANRANFDQVSSGMGSWQLLSATYTPALTSLAQKLQFIASGGAATFYVDTVSISEANPNLAGLTQQVGTPSGGSSLLTTSWNFQPGGQNVTVEMTASKATTHLFTNGVYAGPRDPVGNVNSQIINFQYRPSSRIDANGNRTQMNWSSDGGQLKQVADALGNQTNFDYNIGGNSDSTLNYSLDAQNRKTQYFYNDTINPRLPTDVKVFDKDGMTLLRWQKFNYDSKGRTLTEKTLDPADGSGNTVQQEVDRSYYTSGNGNGLLQTVTQKDLLNAANDLTTTYSYDSAGRVVQTQQSATFGNCTRSFTLYDATGNVLASICNYDPGVGADPTTVAQAIALYNSVTPDKNRVTTYGYDTLGRRVQITSDAGAAYAQTAFTVYDALSRVSRTISNYVSATGITDPYVHSRVDFTHGANNDQNLITETAYNERGFVKRQTDVLGNVTLYGYDDAGRLVQTIQNASRPSYDNSSLGGDPTLSGYMNGLLSSAPDKDLIATNQYDAVGNLVKTTDVLGNVTLMGYDALNRSVRTVRNASQPNYNLLTDPTLATYTAISNPDQDMVDFTEYDALGRVRRTQDVNSSWTLYGYDALGRQVTTIRHASQPNYNLTLDPSLNNYVPNLSSDQDVLSQTAYDSFGRVMYTTDTLGRRTWSVYDGLGRVVKTIANAVGTATDSGLRDPRSLSYQPSTDSDKDLISFTTYDLNGYVLWTQDTLGRKTWFAYDSVGRQIKTIVNAAGSATDNGVNDPRSPVYQPSSSPDLDIIAQTVYDPQGRVSASVNPQGNQTRYFYDGLGRRLKTVANYVTGTYNPILPDRDLTSITTYDLAGRVVVTTDARGTQTTFTYDAAGRRLKVMQAANTPLASTSYTCYDKGAQVLRVIQNYVYDPTQPSPDARDSQGNWLFVPNIYGRNNDQNLITTFTLDKVGRQIQSVGPLGLNRSNLVSLSTVTGYYKDGQIESVTDPGGDTTKYRYDGLRRRTLVVNSYIESDDPSGWHWTASASQWQKSNSDPVPLNTQGKLNSRNLIVQVVYDKIGRILSQRDPNGNLTQYNYDQLSRRTQLTNPLNQTWQTNYSNLASGQTRLTMINPGLTPTSTQQTFDRVGRLASLQYLNEGTKVTPDVAFTYDKLGNRRTMVETNGTATVRSTTYTFDNARRLTSAAFDNNGDGSVDQTVSYAYDAGGLRTQLTLPGNLTVTYSYNTRGQLVNLTDWSNQLVRYAYDQVGRLVSMERNNGLRSAYQYDAAGRLTLLRHTQGRKTLGHFAYDPGKRGNIVKILEGLPRPDAGTTTLNSSDAALEYYEGSWAVTNGFNGSSNFSAAMRATFLGDQATLNLGVGPDHGICDIYIDDALWQSIDNYAVTATDTPQAITIQLNNEGPHLLEIRNRPEKNRAAAGYKVRFYSLVIPYLYDLHTVSLTRNSGSIDGYDGQGRLWFADYYMGANLQGAPYLKYEYSYDLAGNRTQQTKYAVGRVPYQAVSTFSYDVANRMTTDQIQTYDVNQTLLSNTTSTLTYDTTGRMTSDGTNSYSWDAANRLIKVNNTAYQYVYDGEGRRVQQTNSSVLTQYLIDIQPGLSKILSATSGTNTARYVHGLTGIQAYQQPNTTWLWALQDALGSVRVETNASFAVLGDRTYEPYGTPDTMQGAISTPYGFTGEPTDGNGLVHLRARYYNPALGALPSLDPLEGDAGRVLSLNRYSYVQANPINLVDPSGMFPDLSNLCLADLFNQYEVPFTYNRWSAGHAAWELSTHGPSQYPIVKLPAYSGMFISLSLYAGGFPMTKAGPGKSDGEIGIQKGWRAHVNDNGLVEGNSVWNNHNDVNSYNPATDDRLIGYVFGSQRARPSSGYRTVSSKQLPIQVGDVVDNANTDNASVNPVGLQNQVASLIQVQQGDYVFINSSNPRNARESNTHGYIVVGKGPALSCADAEAAQQSLSLADDIVNVANAASLKLISGISSGVPYVADWSGEGPRKVRPFYCSQPEFNHTYWNFITVPDSGFVNVSTLYSGANFAVTATGKLNFSRR